MPAQHLANGRAAVLWTCHYRPVAILRGWDFKNPFTLVMATGGAAMSLIVAGTRGWGSAGWYFFQYALVALIAASPPMARRAARAREKRAERKAKAHGPPFETARDRDG